MLRLATHKVHYHVIITLLRDLRGLERVTGLISVDLRLCNTALKSEEMSQQWGAVDDIVSALTGTGNEPQTFCTDSDVVTN